MAVSHFSCLRGFLTFSIVGVLGVFVHLDVAASSATKVIHKRVGDTVELSPNAKNEGITMASWKFENSPIASNYFTVKPTHFTRRVHFNDSNYSLTVKELTVQDSGDFTFVSEVANKQQPTFTITLRVHEPPLLRIVNFTFEATNLSCTVLLECNSNADHSATYSWTMRNQITTGSKLHYFNTPQGEEINFTCMISNNVHQKSALMEWTCRNQSSDQVAGPVNILLIGGVTGGCLLLVIFIGAVVCFRSVRGKQAADECGDQNDVYASIPDEERHFHTVYDVLQLNRDVPAPAYQEVL